MLNLTHYNESATEFLASVIKSKRNSPKDPDFKARIQALESLLASNFTTYDDHFAADTLQVLISAGYSGQQEKDLKELYSYHSAIMQKLKSGVTTVELKRLINTCQNCTISEINSFDHAVPQTEFPEFTVHPKNLFPSCTICNGHKSNVWRKNGDRLFLNLYIDKLPELQYVFVNVKVKPGDIDTEFYISNLNGIDPALFGKIKYHYHKLDLCNRYSDNNDKVITPLKNSLIASLNSLTMAEAVQVGLDTAQRNRKSFGFNYWKSILEIALLNSPDFLKICEDER